MKYKKINLVVLTLVLVFSILGQVGSVGIDTGNYYLDVPLPIASYYIGQFTNGSTFAVNGSNWDCFIVSTDAGYVWNQTLGNMTNGGKLQFGSGIFQVNSKIVVQYDGTTMSGMTNNSTTIECGSNFQIELAGGSDGDLTNIVIEYFYFDGNWSSRTANPAVIYFHGTGDTLKLSYFHLRYCTFFEFASALGRPYIEFRNYDYLWIHNNMFNRIFLKFSSWGHPSSNVDIYDNFLNIAGTEPWNFIEVQSNGTGVGRASCPNTYRNHFFGTDAKNNTAIFINATIGDSSVRRHTNDRTENCQYLRCVTSGSYVINFGQIIGGVFMDDDFNDSIYIDLDQNTESIIITANVFTRAGTMTDIVTYIKDRNDVSGNGQENQVYGNTFHIDSGEVAYTTTIDRTGATTKAHDNINHNPMVEPFTWLISTDGTNYYAQSGDYSEVITSTNCSYVFQYCIDDLIGDYTSAGNGGVIFVKNTLGVTEYDFADVPIALTDYWNGSTKYGGSVEIIAEGRPSKAGVIFKGNGSSIITTKSNPSWNGSYWVQGQNGGFHSISNIRFHHTTQSASDITLNFTYLTVELHDVVVNNSNSTRQGTGILDGGNDGTDQGAGRPSSWDTISVYGYAVNVEFCRDHRVITNINLFDASDKSAYFHHINGGTFTILRLSFHDQANAGDGYFCYFEDIQGEGLTLYDVHAEIAGDPEKPFFFYNTSGTDRTVEIYGFTALEAVGERPLNHTILMNGTSGWEGRIQIHSMTGGYVTHNQDTSSVGNGTWILHKVCMIPQYMSLSLTGLCSHSEAVVVGVIASNTTHFQVGLWHTDDSASHDTVNYDIYWEVDINYPNPNPDAVYYP